MQGSNNGRIKMARQKVRFDDENWGGYSASNTGKNSKKTKQKNKKPTPTDKDRMLE